MYTHFTDGPVEIRRKGWFTVGRSCEFCPAACLGPQAPGKSLTFCIPAAPSQHSLPANRNHPAWRSPLPFAPAASRPSREQDTKKRVLSRWKAAQRGRGLQLRPRAATRRVASHPRVLGTCLVSAQKALFSQKSLRTEMIGPVLSVFLGAAQQRWRSPQVEGQEGLVSVPPWLSST